MLAHNVFFGCKIDISCTLMNSAEVFYESQWENSEIVLEIFVFIICLAVNFFFFYCIREILLYLQNWYVKKILQVKLVFTLYTDA